MWLHPCKLTISWYLFARLHLLRHIGYLRYQQQVDLWPFDLESGIRVTCDIGYRYANFSPPRRLCSRVTPDVRDRQTSDVRQTSEDRRQTKASLNASAPIGRRHNNIKFALITWFLSWMWRRLNKLYNTSRTYVKKIINENSNIILLQMRK